MFSAQWRDDDDYLVDDPTVMQLACWATGVYDQDAWYASQVPDDVWDLVASGEAEAVTARIEAGASWTEAVALAGSSL